MFRIEIKSTTSLTDVKVWLTENLSFYHNEGWNVVGETLVKETQSVIGILSFLENESSNFPYEYKVFQGDTLIREAALEPVTIYQHRIISGPNQIREERTFQEV